MNNENQQKLIKAIEKAFDRHTVSALIHVAPFYESLKRDPDKAIEQISEIYNRALDEAYTDKKGINNRSFIEAIAGGPCETIPWQVYNAVGTIYPHLSRDQKDRALKQLIPMWDGENFAIINGEMAVGHTTGIREPLLLSDIAIARPIYWPGLHDQENLWKNHTFFYDLQKEIMDGEGMFKQDIVNSDFLVAYALLRSDFCSFGESYAKAANPEFLGRVLQGIVAMRFADGRKNKTTQEDIFKGRQRLEELLPKSLHDRIEPIRLTGDWVDATKF